MLLFINNRSYFIKLYQLLNNYTTRESKSKNFTKILTRYIFGINTRKLHFSPLHSLFSLFHSYFLFRLSLSPKPNRSASNLFSPLTTFSSLRQPHLFLTSFLSNWLAPFLAKKPSLHPYFSLSVSP